MLIIGIAGACRRIELLNLTTKNVIDLGDVIVVELKDTKNYENREFAITAGILNNINLLDIVRKYKALRPSTATHDRFFFAYRNGKCISQPVGINTIGVIPRKIAEFLGVSNPELYTGHCFRRTSAKLLVDAGAGLIALKQHGKWKSTTVAEGYVASSIPGKTKIANGILGNKFSTTNPSPSTSRMATSIEGRTALATIASNPLASTSSNVSSIALDSDASSVTKAITVREDSFAMSTTVSQLSQHIERTKANDHADFLDIAQRNMQGTNMFKCTINYNYYGKK